MGTWRSVRRALVAACVAATLGSTAFAATAGARPPIDRGVVAATDLSEVEATGPIVDRVLDARPVRAAAPRPSRTESFDDGRGNTISIGTSIVGLDLTPFASTLAGVLHGSEMSDLRTVVVAPNELRGACGGGDGVVACYYADELHSGEMVIPSTHPQLQHAIVHEYGHHMDNQLLNLGHLGLCDSGDDGSRRWFFARDADDDVINQSGCSGRVDYTRVLSELYAEDFVVANGIDEWFSSAFPPPSERVVRALLADISDPFVPRARRYRGRLPAGFFRPRRFDFETHVFFTASLAGPRRADFDLRLMRLGRSRPVAVSLRPRSRERLTRVLAPGRYRLDVLAVAGRGPYRLRVAME